jgi:hypothetical protein
MADTTAKYLLPFPETGDAATVETAVKPLAERLETVLDGKATLTPAMPPTTIAAGSDTEWGDITPGIIGTNTWNDLGAYTAGTGVVSFPVTVPAGKRWLCHLHGVGHYRGTHAITYHAALGVQFSGAFAWTPSAGAAGRDALKAILTVMTAPPEEAWLSLSGSVWLPAGTTTIRLVHALDSGGVYISRRTLSLMTVLAMDV